MNILFGKEHNLARNRTHSRATTLSFVSEKTAILHTHNNTITHTRTRTHILEKAAKASKSLFVWYYLAYQLIKTHHFAVRECSQAVANPSSIEKKPIRVVQSTDK